MTLRLVENVVADFLEKTKEAAGICNSGAMPNLSCVGLAIFLKSPLPARGGSSTYLPERPRRVPFFRRKCNEISESR